MGSAAAYAATAVAVERSQAEARKLLLAHGASHFAVSEGEGATGRYAAVEFVHDGQQVRMRVGLKAPDEDALAARARRAQRRTLAELRREAHEQEARRTWRVLVHSLKARLVAVDEGLETMAQAFLPHLVDPATDQTLWEAVRDRVEAGALRVGGPGLAGGGDSGPLALGPGGDNGAGLVSHRA